MSETMEYEGLIRGMGDVVFDDESVGESLYHYSEPPPAQQPAQQRAQQRRRAQGDGLSDDQPAAKPAPVASAPVAAVPQRGLKTPMILGLSAGVFAAAGVYSWMRWKRGEPEGAGQLAGVAGGASALAVAITILAARGAGLLDRGQQKA